MKIILMIRKHWFLVALLAYFFVIRGLFLSSGVIPFSFDHGKDSLAILSIVKTGEPKFIGPWTSIPGLYFGPGWYYLLAPGYFLSNGSPFSGVLVMIALVAVQVVLAYRYFGRWAALLVATTPMWLVLSKSAWNPFPMTLISFLILIALQHLEQKKIPKASWIAVLFGSASLGFHFSTAFAVFYLILIPLWMWMKKCVLTLKLILVGSLAFVLPFLPQALFELKHGFVQTKAVISYLQQGEGDSISPEKILSVTRITLGEFRLGVFPEIRHSLFGIQLNILGEIFFALVLLSGIQGLVQWKEKKIAMTYIAIPLIGFCFLHFNVWYVLSLLPIVVIAFSKVLERAKWWISAIFGFLLLLTPISDYLAFRQNDMAKQQESREMLPAKLRAVEYIERDVGNRPFASYHYVPDIYDFSYQYLYIWRAFEGRRLPVEFSYVPQVSPYVQDKDLLLSRLEQDTRQPEVIYYVVEKAQNKDFLAAWWGQQRYSTIVHEETISPEITVFVALP